MKFNIRSNMFETNSSSAHAITIYPKGKQRDAYGKRYVALDEYGYKDEDGIDPASFLWTAICVKYSENSQERERWRKKIDEALGGNCTFDDPCSKRGYYMYDTDYMSIIDMLDKDDNLLRAYLLGVDTEVATSNDNDGYLYEQWCNESKDGYPVNIITDDKIVIYG